MTLTITQAKNNLSDLVNRAAYGGERIVLGARGRPKAAIIGLDDLRLLQQVEEKLEELEDAVAAWEGLAEYHQGDTISWDQVKAELLRTSDVPA